MNFPRLIAWAARHKLEGHDGALGVRLSPVAIQPEEVAALRQCAEAECGEGLHLAVSTPGLVEVDEPRFCAADGECAAERATAWRNTIRVSEGERILYVSAETHGKAGGLEDCLIPLHREDLVEAFVAHLQEKEHRLPKKAIDVLKQIGVLDYIEPRALCAFEDAAMRRVDRGTDPWSAVGESLPELSLASDTHLRALNVERRLPANLQLVKAAATGETRVERRLAEPVKQTLSSLRSELRRSTDVNTNVRVLSTVTLSELKTADLERVLPSSAQAKRKKGSPGSKKGEEKKSKRTRRKRGPSDQAAEKVHAGPFGGATTDYGTRALSEALGTTPQFREDQLAGRAREVFDSVPAQEVPLLDGGADVSEAPVMVWTEQQHRREFGVPSGQLAAGLEAFVRRLVDGSGAQLVWDVIQENPREALAKPSLRLSEATEVPAPHGLTPELDVALERWTTARGNVARRFGDQESSPMGLATLVTAPLVALSISGLVDEVRSLVGASAELFRVARSIPGTAASIAVLMLDTVCLRAANGRELLLLGPFHCLWLSQATARFDALLAEKDIDDTARRLLVRSLTQTPSAPQTWPVGEGRELVLTEPASGLIAYAPRATALSSGTASELARSLGSLFLELMPHAHLGLRVALRGDNVDGLISGFATLARETRQLQSLELYSEGGMLAVDDDEDEALTTRVRLLPLPLSDDALVHDVDPHLLVHVDPVAQLPEHQEVAPPGVQAHGVGSGVLCTMFSLDSERLRAETPISELPALRELDAAHAQARGRIPRGVFVSETAAVALTVPFPRPSVGRGAWEVAVGARLGRTPPPDSRLLVHERVGDNAWVAVCSQDLAPASRALRGVLERIGLEDQRPRVLTALAETLAVSGTGGLLSITATPHQLVAAALLGLVIRRDLSSQGVTARLCGDSYSTLLSGNESDDPYGAVVLAVEPSKAGLRFVIGYAAIESSVDLSTKRGQLSGKVAQHLERLHRALVLAVQGETLGATAAREELNWLLWPAVASARPHPHRLITALEDFGRNPQEIELVLLLPPSAAFRGPLRLGEVTAKLVELNSSLLDELCLDSLSRQ